MQWNALILEQITKQLAKLVDVRDIKVLEPDNSVSRELVLVKVTAKPEQREGIISIANIFRANVIDVGKDSLVIELTGSKSKLRRSWIFWKTMRFWNLPEQGSQDFPEERQM